MDRYTLWQAQNLYAELQNLVSAMTHNPSGIVDLCKTWTENAKSVLA